MTDNYHLAICELFNPTIHGFVENVSSKDVETHYLVNETLSPDQLTFDYTDKDPWNFDNLAIYACWRTSKFQSMDAVLCNHNYIRNYRNIMSNEHMHLPNIVKSFTLPGGELVAVIKMFWLKCIQRKWKKIVQQRKLVIQHRKQSKSLIYREIHHTWPLDCRILPTLQGMFYE